MIIDFSQMQPAAGSIAFPDYPFPDKPKSPDEIVTAFYLMATAEGVYIFGHTPTPPTPPTPPVTYTPSLQFNDARNSQYMQVV